MRNKLIAIAAIVMAPALASAQGGGGGGGGGGHGGGTAAGTGGQGGQSGAATSGGVSTGGQTGDVGAANPPTTAEERHHDSLVVQWRKQHGQSGADVQQQATGGVAVPGADTGTAARRDTTSNKTTAQSDTSMRRDTSTVQGAAGGEVAPHRGRSRNMGLSTDQVKQLQQAINSAGCNAGPADGRFGRETRQGVQCVRQQKNITEKGLNPVLQALNLNFTASPSASDTSSMGGQRRMHPDTTGTASQQYQSPKKAQHGRGMHDSTTSKSDTSHKQ